MLRIKSVLIGRFLHVGRNDNIDDILQQAQNDNIDDIPRVRSE